MKLGDLQPGDRQIIDGIGSAIFIGMITPHPLFHKFSLVIWWMENVGQYGFDALDTRMELIGRIETHDRVRNLQKALRFGPE